MTTDIGYDPPGRVGAARVGTNACTCLSYDTRGRLASTAVPAFNGSPMRTVTTNYAVVGNPLSTSVVDAAGAITTTSLLLARTVRYTDVNGIATTGYDQAGRATTTTSDGAGGGTSTVTTGYDDAGRTTTVSLDGKVLAQPVYDGNGELASVAYPAAAAANGSSPATGGNGMTLAGLTQDAAGRDTGSTFTVPAGGTVTDALTLSQARRVTTSTAAKNGTVYANWVYGYDAAERLVQAALAATTGHPKLTLGYGFAGTGGCGMDISAGLDSARVSATRTIGTGTASSTAT